MEQGKQRQGNYSPNDSPWQPIRELALRRVRGLRPGWLLPTFLKLLPTPEIVFYLDVHADTAHARISNRAADTETLEHLDMFDNAYRALQACPFFIVIDANHTTEQIVDNLLQELGFCGLGLQP